MNKFGNKGGVIIKFLIDDTSISFANVHLESGKKKYSERLVDIKEIHEKAFQSEAVGKQKVKNFSSNFFFSTMFYS